VTEEFDDLVKVAAGVTVSEADIPGGGIESAFERKKEAFPVKEKKSVSTFKRTKKAPKKKKKVAAKTSRVSGGGVVEEPEAKPFEYFDKALLKIVAGLIPFGLLVSFTGDSKYELTEQEKAYLARYWDDVLMKYLPDVLAEYGEESVLIGAIGLLVIQKSGFLKVLPVETEKKSGINLG